MWKYFSEDELKCKHTGICKMDPEFMETLEKIREEVGIPFIITSAYRDPTHPIARSSRKWQGCRYTYTRRGRLKVYRSSVKTRYNRAWCEATWRL
jgi:hypothetical protein